MKKCRALVFLCVIFLSYSQVRATATKPGHAGVKSNFIENKGQWDSRVKFKAELPYGALFLESNCLTYTFLHDKAVERLLNFKYREDKNPLSNPVPGPYVPACAYKVRFLGAKANPLITPSLPYPEYQNYFLGHDPSHWSSRVNQYNYVTYKELYDGVDLQVKQEAGRLKYNFYLKPGADPSAIKLSYEGIGKLRVKDDKLLIITSVNRIEELAPLAWQVDGEGNKKEVVCKFHVEDNTVTFRFQGKTDRSSSLVIDPILVFSSYTGSPVDNWGYTATYDNDGFLYTGGSAFMIGYPTITGSFQVNYGGGSSDIVISKFDTTGSFMVYSTYIGGSGSEVPTSLIVNNNNELLVLGTTGSDDFPVTGQSYDQVFHGGTAYSLTNIIHYNAGSDLVISKLSADGTSMLASTYFGGSGNDGLNTPPPLRHNYADDARGEIKLDKYQNVYVCSSTQSSDLPVTTGAYQGSLHGAQDACVVKFDPTLTYVLWDTYLGGSGAEAGYSIIIDDSSRIYVAGGTTSTDFPVTAGTIQQVYHDGGCDGFISCLNSNATSLIYSTYLGSTAYDQVYFIDKDKQGNIYVLGQTSASGSTFIFNAAWSMPSGGQFITKLHPDLSNVIFSTTFGTGNGGPDISPTAFMVDNCNYIYVSGWGGASLNGFGGTSGLPVTPNAFQTTTDGKDYYFLVMEGDASGLVYATFFGGPQSAEHVDGGTSRFDKKGRIYQSVCAGCGSYDDFPTTTGAWSRINGSTNCNNGVIKFDFKIPLVIADFVHPPAGCSPDTVTFQNSSYLSGNTNAQYHWDFGDGNTSTLKNPVHIFTAPGNYLITLIVTDTGSCNYADTTKQLYYVLGNVTQYLPVKYICKNESVQIGVNPLPDASLTYTWFPANNLNNGNIPNPTATPLTTTDYYLLISNGICSDTLIQHVRVYDLKVNAGNDTIICTSSLQLTATANEDSVRFQWSTNPFFTDTLNSSLASNSVTVNLQNQNTWFYIRVFNDYCEAIDSVNISFAIFISPGGGLNPSCADSCNGSAVVDLTGGYPPFEYLWNTGQTTDSISGLCAGTYIVTVTDSVNCISISTVILTDPSEITLDFYKIDIPCNEICSGKIFAYVTGGTGPYQYLWNNNQTADSLTNLCAGSYSLSITDDHGCKADAKVDIVVNSIFLDVHVNASPDTIYQGLSTQLTSNLLPGCTYSWSPTTNLSDPNISNPVANPSVTTIYFLTITDPFGCQYIDSVNVIIKEVTCREPFIYIPSAFTPNGDNKNDVILVQGNFIEKIQLTIYDRWGNRVFETTDPKSGWDGNFKGKRCEPGVYVYYLEVGCYNKEEFKKKGNITLIR